MAARMRSRGSMSDEALIVFVGWLNLTPSQQAEFLEAVNSYIASSPLEKSQTKRLTEAARLVAGPLGLACPCCGRTAQ
jgi:predicted AAA+ superfamily ATPase